MKQIFTPLEIKKAKKNHKKNKSLTGFKDKNVLIMGLGLIGGGLGVAKFFCKQGAKVLVTDLKTKSQLRESLKKLKGLPIKYVLGKHREKDFIKTDLIIKNPAVPQNSPYLRIAKKHKIPIKTDIEIFFDLCPGEIIGVTGTKGKSYTATLIYKFLKTKYPDTILAGNIGVSPLEILSRVKKSTKVVLELSSFELEDLKKSPHIAVITTLFPDHLNRYKNFREYVEAKKSIFKYQKKNDILILNADNPKTKELSSQTKSKVYFFSDNSKTAAALKVAKLLGVSDGQIKKVLSEFKGLANRQEFIAEKRGVKYFNDTAATTPQSVILAIRDFKRKLPKSHLILIAGGQDKELSYKELAREIKERVDYLVLLPGSASDKIKKELVPVNTFKIYWAKSMKEAVKKAESLAQKGDIVLLSPGAASFNLFKNEFDRGKQFVQVVKKL